MLAREAASEPISALIVEDSKLQADSLAMIIRSDLGWEVDIASNFDQALAMFKTRRVDLILADMVLTSADSLGGLRLVRAIRDLEIEDPPVMLVLTAFGSAADAVAVMEAGADSYIEKGLPGGPMLALIEQKAGRGFERRLLKKQLAEHQARIESELASARAFQVNLHPREEVLAKGWRVACFSEVCSGLTGDFIYISKPLHNRKIFCCLGDVVDHGVKAALIAGMVWFWLDSTISKRKSVAAIADSLADVNFMSAREFFTLAALELRPGGEVIYLNAGHPEIMLARASGEILRMATTGVAVSGSKIFSKKVHTSSLALDYGDRLIVASDGLIEARNGFGELFGEERLRDSLAATSGLSATQSLRELKSRWARFIGSAESRDDVSVVVIQRDSEARELRVRLKV